MLGLRRRWASLSIGKKLYGVIGVMAVLIVLELITLWFAMNILSSVRAFVAGEGLWSKAQKDATFSLQRYGVTKNESDYRSFVDHLRVCDGDRMARRELEKRDPDPDIVRAGFLRGGNHPDDIDAMIHLLRRFHWIKYIRRAVAAWGGADELLIQLRARGEKFRGLLHSDHASAEDLHAMVSAIGDLNLRLTALEDEFSRVLGEGSRWLEGLIITILSLAVLTVESIGLSLAFLTSRSLTRGLSEISSAALAIGYGDFARRVVVRQSDEIGVLGRAINVMGEMLGGSYAELERRVTERTAELAKAVKARDDFLSVASHELKTPLTSLKLQNQLRRRLFDSGEAQHFTPDRLDGMLRSDERQVSRLVQLVEDMLDISRLGAKRFHLTPAPMDLSALVRGLAQRFEAVVAEAGARLDLELAEAVPGEWDAFRLEQVAENLLTNAIKYGQASPIRIRTWFDEDCAYLSVSDRGQGIAPENQERIFAAFERATTGNTITGLGLGLFIADEIVRMHGGRLTVDSELGRGAIFQIRLPRKAASVS